jgi:hypothetical protein
VFVHQKAQEEFVALQKRVMLDYKAVSSALADTISDLPGFKSEWPKVFALGCMDPEELEKRIPDSVDVIRKHREKCNLPVLFVITSTNVRFMLDCEGTPLTVFEAALYERFVRAWRPNYQEEDAHLSEFRRLLKLNSPLPLVSQFLESRKVVSVDTKSCERNRVELLRKQ